MVDYHTILVDTNVLLRISAPGGAQQHAAIEATKALKKDGYSLVTSIQNLIEAWNVATRPAKKNGFGYSPSRTQDLLSGLESAFPRLPDPPDVFERWLELVLNFEVSGVQVHDARLVVVMLSQDLRHI